MTSGFSEWTQNFIIQFSYKLWQGQLNYKHMKRACKSYFKQGDYYKRVTSNTLKN